MAGQRSDVLESLTPQVRNRVEALKEIQVRQVSYHIILYFIELCRLIDVVPLNLIFWLRILDCVYSPSLFECQVSKYGVCLLFTSERRASMMS